MEDSRYFFADDTKNVGSHMNSYSPENNVNKATKWSKQNRLEFNMAKFEKICFDVKKLDRSSVHIYADDTEITCKFSVNDLVIIITTKLNWENYINQWLSKAQQSFFLEEKRSIFYKYEGKIKFLNKLSFLLSILLYASNV